MTTTMRINIALLALILVWKGILATNTTKIVNGSPADIEKYPFIVGFSIRKIHFCGGAIISNNYVLTAAHCMIGNQYILSHIVMYCGNEIINGEGQVYKVDKFRIHKNFSMKPVVANDIALVKSKGKFEFSSKIQPIPIAPIDFPVNNGDLCNIAGWGVTEEGSKIGSDILLEAYVPIYDFEECMEIYTDGAVSENTICAGYEDGGIDACQGDSGGPLVLHDTLIGVVSFGRGCARKHPGVYTDVRKYNDWISDHSDED